MNEKKEYLNEEWYQGVKKKITRISLIILVIAIIIGAGLILTGIIKINETKKTNDERYNTAYKESQNKVAASKARLSEITTEKEELNKQYDTKIQQCNSLNMRDSDWYTKASQCNIEASEITTKINNLETEEFQLKNADYTVYYDKVSKGKYYLLIFLGIGTILIGGMISLIFYVIAKRREITAFTTQQVMPVAQEGIEKMAPTIGNAAGSIAKGIKEGLQEVGANKPTVESESQEEKKENNE